MRLKLNVAPRAHDHKVTHLGCTGRTTTIRTRRHAIALIMDDDYEAADLALTLLGTVPVVDLPRYRDRLSRLIAMADAVKQD